MQKHVVEKSNHMEFPSRHGPFDIIWIHLPAVHRDCSMGLIRFYRGTFAISKVSVAILYRTT